MTSAPPTASPTNAAASISIRSTVSPAVRHGASGQRCQRLRPWPIPGRRHVAVERVESRARGRRRWRGGAKRPPAGRRSAARGRAPPACRPVAVPGGRRAKHMQPVADLHLLEVAEIGVERLQRLAGVDTCRVRGRGRVRRPSAVADDLPLEVLAPPPVDAGGKRVLVDQRLQRRERPVEFGPGHRRHQVVDDHRRGAPLGLRPLAGIVDDEGIDERRRRRGRAPASTPPTAPAPCPAAIRDCRACRDGRSRRRRRPRAARRGRRGSHGSARGRRRGGSPCRRRPSRATAAPPRRHCRSAGRGSRSRRRRMPRPLRARPSAPSPPRARSRADARRNAA